MAYLEALRTAGGKPSEAARPVGTEVRVAISRNRAAGLGSE